MRNHEWVPISLIEKISHMKRANAFKIIKLLLKHKLVTHTSRNYDGYKLTFLGYDYLALRVLKKRGVIETIENQIGVGKESDIYTCRTPEGRQVVLKLARLGRTSFRTVKTNRDYLKGKTHFNWLYLSRLAAMKEYCFMQALYENGFPTPEPIDANRHAIIMSKINGNNLQKVKKVSDPEPLYHKCMDLLVKFTQHGLIHCDFNEFNLMVTQEQELFVIDFPQMVSTNHPRREYYFNRDQEGVHTLFKRRFEYVTDRVYNIDDIEVIKQLDKEIQASGVDVNDLDILQQYIEDNDQELANDEREALEFMEAEEDQDADFEAGNEDD